MKNKYKIINDTTIIYAESKGISYEIIVDTEDLELISSFGTWSIAHEKSGKVGRVVSGKPMKYLHKIIMNYYGKDPIDHIDRNPLNNKKENLRMSTTSQNGQNRALNINSNTGVRGLTWDKNANKYRARVQVNGKRNTIGHFDTIEEGAKALKEYRIKNTTSID